MSIKNIKLIIEYKGTKYFGWQSQSGGNTIQDLIEEAVFKTTAQKVSITAAGRTDAGVHAVGQVANFSIEHSLEPSRYKDALNYYLPEDIRIKSSEKVSSEFNARYDAIGKRYRYLVSEERSALYHDYRWEIADKLDREVLKKAAENIAGEHDFSAFCVTASLKEDNRCRIDNARWFFIGPLLVFEIRGNRFLHSMIRSLVGAMVNLATSAQDKNRLNLTLEKFVDIIRAQLKERVTFTAPPQGLYLVSVQYKDEIGQAPCAPDGLNY